MTDGAADGPAAPPTNPALPVFMPAPVRQRVVAFAADRLGQLPDADVPPALRRVSRFTPSKRARLADAALAAAVDADPVFRNAVADSVRAALPQLASALSAGAPPPAADPYDAAAAAYLLRSPGWQEIVAASATVAERSAQVASADAATDEASRLRQQLEEARAAARDERDKHRSALAESTAVLDDVRRRLKHALDAARKAEESGRRAESERDTGRAAADKAAATAAAELRRLRARIAELEAQVEQTRKSDRGARNTEDVRLWLLLDSVTNAAAGLRRELALPPASARPADEVAAAIGEMDRAAPGALGLAKDNPGWLDALLAVPGTHLLVDGYNVTKTGFPGVPLEAQRIRLVQGLAALAARTAAEITVVFDGAERTGPLAAPSGRGVRVLFSPAGRTADDVLVQLVRAEPTGRSVVVVSADREVVSRSEQAGARGVPPQGLLGLLGRS